MPLSSPLSLSLHPPPTPSSPWSICPSPSRARFPTAVLSSLIRHHKPSSHSPPRAPAPSPTTPLPNSTSTARPGEDFSNFVWDHQSIPDHTRTHPYNWEHEQSLTEIAKLYSSVFNRKHHHSLPSTLAPAPSPVSAPASALQPIITECVSNSPRSPAFTAASALRRKLHPRPAAACRRDHKAGSKCSCSSASSFSDSSLPSPIPLVLAPPSNQPSTDVLVPHPNQLITDLPVSPPAKPVRKTGGPDNISTSSASSASSAPSVSSEIRVLPRNGLIPCAGPLHLSPQIRDEYETEGTETEDEPVLLARPPQRSTSLYHTRSIGRMRSVRAKIAQDYVIFKKSNVLATISRIGPGTTA